MANIVIHVGLHKTGTTFLQYEIFSKLKNTNCTFLLKYETKIYDDKINIISDEELSVNPFTPTYHREHLDCDYRFVIADRLHSIFPDAKIILGIRDKESWVRSIYSQYVKSGGIYSFDIFRKDIFDESFLDFDAYIKCLKGLFDEVFVYHLEDLKKDNDSFVKNICDFIGAEVPDYESTIYENKLSKRQIKMALFLNRFFASDFNPKRGIIPWTPYSNPRFIIDPTYWRTRSIVNKRTKRSYLR